MDWHQITGDISVSIRPDPIDENIEQIYCEWTGGNIVALSHKLLANLDSRYARLDGGILTICQYRMRIIERDILRQVIVAMRIDDTVESEPSEQG